MTYILNSREFKVQLEERFRRAAENVKKLKQPPSEDDMLELYSFYKQAEFGDCNIPKPGLLDFTGRAKWEAWNSRRGVLKHVAQKSYAEKAEGLIEQYGLK